jgi:hypothetical protein
MVSPADTKALPMCAICSCLAWWTTHHPECRCCGRLAAPPLAPEIVAVLEAAWELSRRHSRINLTALYAAVGRYCEAGRPGLLPAGKEPKQPIHGVASANNPKE